LWAEVASRASDGLLISSRAIAASGTDIASGSRNSLGGVAVAVHAWWAGDLVVESGKRTVLQSEIAARTRGLLVVAVGRSHEVAGCFFAILSAGSCDRV
jgi:hypothetical protein